MRKTTVELQTLVDTHEQPFVIIDSEYRIVVVNQAYERQYGECEAQLVGQHCYRTRHGNQRPCHEYGEACPHQRVMQTAEVCACLHTHFDCNGNRHEVRIKAFPIRGVDGEMYMGETLYPVNSPASTTDRKEMAGSSAMFKQVVDQLRLAATSDAPVLVEGETGTGKDLAASFIHEHSARRDKPFLTLDCTVLTESLFESEVFGHMRGAFTGAIADKPGLFELADGGTLVLDEIGELSALSQAKLLRVLETGEFRRVGGRKVLHANVRVICATNRCLRSAVQQQGFRQDLFYRVACLPIRMPSLRERLDDIPELVEALLNRIQWRGGRRYSITDKALHWLQSYHFPGNIRELRNILEASAAQSLDGIIGVEQANDVIERSRRSGSRPNTEDPVSRWGMNGTAAPDADNSATLRNLEADYLVKLLETHQGSKREISRLLGISERTLYRKMKRYGIR